MYIAELCSNWIDSPFWQKSFMVSDQAAIDKIRAAAIEAAWIDTDKGLDVVATDAAASREAAITAEVQRKATPIAGQIRVSMDDEIARAARIVATSREAVFSMFQEARMGRAVAVGDAMPLVEEIASSVLRNPGALIGLARLKTADDYT